MYLRWALCIVALWYVSQHVAPTPLLDLLNMRAIQARMAAEVRR